MKSLEFLFNQQKKLDKKIQYYFSLIKIYITRKSTESADVHRQGHKKNSAGNRRSFLPIISMNPNGFDQRKCVASCNNISHLRNFYPAN